MSPVFEIDALNALETFEQPKSSPSSNTSLPSSAIVDGVLGLDFLRGQLVND